MIYVRRSRNEIKYHKIEGSESFFHREVFTFTYLFKWQKIDMHYSLQKEKMSNSIMKAQRTVRSQFKFLIQITVYIFAFLFYTQIIIMGKKE